MRRVLLEVMEEVEDALVLEGVYLVKDGHDREEGTRRNVIVQRAT